MDKYNVPLPTVEQIALISSGNIGFADLRPEYNTGRAFTISGSGRNRVVGFRTGVKCALGDIDKTEWKEIAKKLIAEAGEQELYERLCEFIRENCPDCNTKTKLEERALNLHVSRIFDDPVWVHFVAFNEKYRPAELRKVALVEVMPECCTKPGVMTRALFERYHTSDNEGFCPYCGKWTKIPLVNEKR